MPKYQRAAIEKHLATLSETAPIRAIAHGSDVEAKLAAFEAADERALMEQGRYRWWGRLALRATTFGTLVGALLLLPIDVWIDGLPRSVIGSLQTLALIVTICAVLLINWLKPIDQWMRYRAMAEQLRGQIFAAVVDGKAPNGTAPGALATQKLDLLLAAYVNDQLTYFDTTIRKLKKATSRYSPMRLFSYLLITLAGVLGVVVAAKSIDLPLPSALQLLIDWLAVPNASRWQLGMATMASSVLAYATARTLMDQDHRNAALYAVTASKLRDFIADHLNSVTTTAAATGDDGALRAFFANARQILEAEHMAWFFSHPPSGPIGTPSYKVKDLT